MELAAMLSNAAARGYITEKQLGQMTEWSETTSAECNPCHPDSTAPCQACTVQPVGKPGEPDLKRCVEFCKGEGKAYRCNRYISEKSSWDTCWGHNPFIKVDTNVLRNVKHFTVTSVDMFTEEDFNNWVNLPKTTVFATDGSKGEVAITNMAAPLRNDPFYKLGESAVLLTLKLKIKARMKSGKRRNMMLEIRFNTLERSNHKQFLTYKSPATYLYLRITKRKTSIKLGLSDVGDIRIRHDKALFDKLFDIGPMLTKYVPYE
jgi:hypothetical protein